MEGYNSQKLAGGITMLYYSISVVNNDNQFVDDMADYINGLTLLYSFLS